MFRRDFDNFRFDNCDPRFMEQGPPGPHGPPHPPPFGGSPPFGGMQPFAAPHFRPPLPMGREAFQEIRDYMLLLIISEYSDGITGYQLQEKYKFPRGTLIRTLQDLEEKGYLDIKEEIVEGRANKFYLITEKGTKFLEELKFKWANLFAVMSEINPPEGMKMMIMERIEQFETKDDAIDFFRGMRSWMKGMLQRIEDRIVKFKKSQSDLDKLIEEVENMDSLNKDKIKEMVIESINKMEENQRNK